jgi:hypothetical protein
MPKKTVYRTKEKNEKLSVTIEKPLRFHCGIRSIIALKADENLFPFIYYYFYFFFLDCNEEQGATKKTFILNCIKHISWIF